MSTERKFEPAQVRLPVSLKDWLRREATANYRSTNAEIVKRLEESRALDQQRAVQP